MVRDGQHPYEQAPLCTSCRNLPHAVRTAVTAVGLVRHPRNSHLLIWVQPHLTASPLRAGGLESQRICATGTAETTHRDETMFLGSQQRVENSQGRLAQLREQIPFRVPPLSLANRTPRIELPAESGG